MAGNLPFFFFFCKNYPSVKMADNGNDWTAVALDTDLRFGTIRSIEVSMMADIKEEFEKLSRIGEKNVFL